MVDGTLNSDRCIDTRGNDLSDEIDEMPREKIEELYQSSAVVKGRCEECDEITWLIGQTGWNGRSQCHECDAGYKVIG